MNQHSYHINTLFSAFFQKRYDNGEDSSGEESEKEVCTAGLDLTELLLEVSSRRFYLSASKVP